MTKLIRRVVATSFWEDTKVIDRFSVEDKFFMLYLMTNPHTTQAGIYKLPYRIAGFETGYQTDVIKVLIDRFESKYHIIAYSKDTQEVAVLNSLKYSVVKGGQPVLDCITSDLKMVESDQLVIDVYKHLLKWWSTSSRPTDNSIRERFAADLKRRKVPKEVYENENENDNDNEESYPDSSHDSYNESSIDCSNSTSTPTGTKAHPHSSKHDPVLSIDQIRQEFESLWSNYPKKQGKKAAFNHYKSWRRESKKHTPTYLHQRLNAYKQHLEANHTPAQYIMNGSTWFNGRFDDVLDVDNSSQLEHGGFDPRLLADDDGNVNTEDLPF